MTSDYEHVNGLATRKQITADEDTNREIGFHGSPASYPVKIDGKKERNKILLKDNKYRSSNLSNKSL